MLRTPNCAKVLLMKRAFTLVELIVSVVMVMLISGGALVYLNEFNSRQKLEKGKDEVVAAIKLVQSHAKGRQLPLGWGEILLSSACSGELSYIKLYTFNLTEGETLIANANECNNPWFYRNSVKNIGITDISIFSPAVSYPSIILFGAGTGRLIGDTKGTPILDTGTATIIVKNEAEKIEGYRIIINALGQIKETIYYEE